LVDNENQTYKTLNEYINVEEIIINQELKNIENIIQESKKYDKIIMATYNVQANDYQQKVFDLLDKEKVVVVSMRSPYDLFHLKDVKSYICIYEVTKESLSSVAKALYGRIPFVGKLPIKLKR
jgi:beta-N-acetylhexosaminidase